MGIYKVTVADVAKLTGLSELTIREGIRQEYFDFGAEKKKEGNTRGQFLIYPAMLAEHLGITTKELFEAIREVRNAESA